MEEEDPTDYFTLKENRSRYDLGDILDEDEKTDVRHQHSWPGVKKQEEAVQFFSSTRNVRRYTDIMTFRTKDKDSSDSDDDK